MSPERPTLGHRMLGFVASGYDRRSPVALLLLITVGAAVGYRHSDLLDANGAMDWLLAGIWAWLAALVCWGVCLRRDLVLIAVGAGGGGVIEWWGTNSGLWSYFTGERPPLWILPAWPIAALSADRLARLLIWLVEELGRRQGPLHASRLFVGLYWVIVPGFVAWMTAFTWPTIHVPATGVVVALMVAVMAYCPNPRRDVVVFLAGSVLGVFLEYWGTSRQCWTYYTGQVPPPVAVLAHGFAALAFTRAAAAADQLLGMVSGKQVSSDAVAVAAVSVARTKAGSGLN